MTLQNSQFRVKWMDADLKPHDKIYEKHDAALKAYKWLIANKAINVDLAIIKRITAQDASKD